MKHMCQNDTSIRELNINNVSKQYIFSKIGLTFKVNSIFYCFEIQEAK